MGGGFYLLFIVMRDYGNKTEDLSPRVFNRIENLLLVPGDDGGGGGSVCEDGEIVDSTGAADNALPVNPAGSVCVVVEEDKVRCCRVDNDVNVECLLVFPMTAVLEVDFCAATRGGGGGGGGAVRGRGPNSALTLSNSVFQCGTQSVYSSGMYLSFFSMILPRLNDDSK